MWPNPQFSADLATFTEEILNGKLHFLCSVCDCLINITSNLQLELPNVKIFSPDRASAMTGSKGGAAAKLRYQPESKILHQCPLSLCETCPNTEFFLVCIFLYSDWSATAFSTDLLSFSEIHPDDSQPISWLFDKYDFKLVVRATKFQSIFLISSIYNDWFQERCYCEIKMSTWL